jgi:hypothetical protein
MDVFAFRRRQSMEQANYFETLASDGTLWMFPHGLQDTKSPSTKPTSSGQHVSILRSRH